MIKVTFILFSVYANMVQPIVSGNYQTIEECNAFKVAKELNDNYGTKFVCVKVEVK